MGISKEKRKRMCMWTENKYILPLKAVVKRGVLNNKPLKVCSKYLASLVKLHSKQITGSKNV